MNRVPSDTVNNTDSDPAANVTTHICTRVSTCSAKHSGMVANAAARPRSARIIAFRRLPRRSTHAPACSPNSRLGSHWSAVRQPIS